MAYSTVSCRQRSAAPICSAANRIAAVSAIPGSGHSGSVSSDCRRASRRVGSMVATGCALKRVHLVSCPLVAATTISAMSPLTT
ncbi:Uncharacterised protein [Mycobacterium tuberculosis]|nr:Uncharacterised protein [Mycobacterium tuberculosis]